MRRISYPPRSGIREHFIIRITVASEQTRADNATPSRKCGSHESERENAVVDGGERVKGGQKQPLLPFAPPFHFISSPRLTSLLYSRTRKTDSFFSLLLLLLRLLMSGTKVGFSTYPRGTFRTQGARQVEGCARRVDLIWSPSELETARAEC